MKLTHLRYFDIIFLAILLFGWAIYSSNYTLFTSLANGETMFFGEELNFSDQDNYYAILNQAFLLILALLYLKFINFDFSQWKFKISIIDTAKAVFLFCCLGLLMDVFLYIGDILVPVYPFVDDNISSGLSLSNLLYSILNGTYEELFFLGICLSVADKDLKKALIFSLIIRFSFHTYQGIYVAIGLGFLLGSAMYFVYKILKVRNLYIFFFAHALADIFGLSLIGILYKF